MCQGERSALCGSLVFPAAAASAPHSHRTVHGREGKSRMALPFYMFEKWIFLDVTYLSLDRIRPVKNKGTGVAIGLD